MCFLKIEVHCDVRGWAHAVRSKQQVTTPRKEPNQIWYLFIGSGFLSETLRTPTTTPSPATPLLDFLATSFDLLRAWRISNRTLNPPCASNSKASTTATRTSIATQKHVLDVWIEDVWRGGCGLSGFGMVLWSGCWQKVKLWTIIKNLGKREEKKKKKTKPIRHKHHNTIFH